MYNGVHAALASVLVLVGCTSTPPHWHVDGGCLRAPDGRAVILRGVEPRHAEDGAVSRRQDSRRLRADPRRLGHERAPLRDDVGGGRADQGQYDDAYLDGVAERLQLGERAGLVVVLDMHEDVYGEGFGFDGAPRWTCDEARYAAFVPTTRGSSTRFDPNVMACVDDFYTTRRSAAALRRCVAPRRRAARALAGGDRLRRAQRARLGHVPDLRSSSTIGSRRSTRGRRGGARGAPDWVAFLEPSAQPQRGHRDRASTRVRVRRRHVRAALVRREGRGGRRLRSGASRRRSSTMSASSRARRRR